MWAVSRTNTDSSPPRRDIFTGRTSLDMVGSLVPVTGPLVTDYAWQGPKRGADRAVLLAHGAGTGMNAASLTVVADALAAAGIPALRFNYPYRSAGRKAPDRPKVLDAATREAAAELARLAKLRPERLVLGGRSMGGRYCSMIVGAEDDPVPARGLLLLGYPLHAAGKPEQQRVEHFPRLQVPVLFVSGTRDSLAGKDELILAAKAISGPMTPGPKTGRPKTGRHAQVTFHWLDTADHGYRPLKSSGRTIDDINAEVAAAAVNWVSSLPD
jgi:uncharacterized protein